MNRIAFAAFLFSFAALAARCAADDRVPEIPADELDRLHAMICPQPGESPWREIAWLTNITEARQRAVAENKPIVIFTAADGSPLSRT